MTTLAAALRDLQERYPSLFEFVRWLPFGLVAEVVAHSDASIQTYPAYCYAACNPTLGAEKIIPGLVRLAVATLECRGMEVGDGTTTFHEELTWFYSYLFKVIPELEKTLKVQVLATTHAPLVLASVEPLFDETRDALFLFDVTGGEVKVGRSAWKPRGNASAWLTSEVFGLKQDRSLEAERMPAPTPRRSLTSNC